MKLNLSKISKILAIFPLAYLIASCENNFQQIEEFGLTSATVQELSNQTARDIYQSCLRRQKFTSDRFPESIDSLYQNVAENCQQAQQQTATFNNVNSILTDYMIALGKIASKNTVSFEQNLAALKTSLDQLNSVTHKNNLEEGVASQQKLDAGFKIAQFVFNQLTNEFRRENLHEAILCTNSSIQEYIPVLILITEEFYLQGILLQDEKITIDDYYRKYVVYGQNLLEESDIKQLDPESQRQLIMAQTQLNFASYNLEQDYIKALSVLEQKTEIANSYLKILEITANTHQQLFNELNHEQMNEQEIETLCQPYFTGSEVDSANNKTNSVTVKQLKRIEQIVLEYNSQIQPHIQQLKKVY